MIAYRRTDLPAGSTLIQMLLNAGREHAARRAFRGPYADSIHEFSYEQLYDLAREAALGLKTLGVQPGDRVAILSPARIEWGLMDLAILLAGAAVVPICLSVSSRQMLYYLENSGARVLAVADPRRLKVLQELGAQKLALEQVVLLNPPAGVIEGLPERFHLATFPQLLERGRAAAAAEREALEAAARALPSDALANLIYTSGTTGAPKGVMLTHANLMHNVRGMLDAVPVVAGDVSLSVLELCHALEHTAGFYTMLTAGAQIQYAENPAVALRQMHDYRPTVMLAVPKLFEKIYDKLVERIEAGAAWRRHLFYWSLAVGRRHWEAKKEGRVGLGLRLAYALADAAVFAKLRASLGGRLRFFISGGAPLGREVAELFAMAGLIILEGYGCTEFAPVLTVNPIRRIRIGTVGQVLPGVELRVTADNEVLARGPNLMKGYWQHPQASAAAIDADGWYHTGDLGRIDADGYLALTGRLKEIIVLDTGQKFSPEPLEQALTADPLVSMAVVFGNDRHYPVALVVPAFEALERLAREMDLAGAKPAMLVREPRVLEMIQQRLRARMRDFATHEQVRKFLLLDRPLDPERGEITVTLKPRRAVLQETFKNELAALYAGG